MSFCNLFQTIFNQRIFLISIFVGISLWRLNFPLISGDLQEITEWVVLEDFEKNRITEENFIVRGNQTRIPEVKMSKNLVSPDLLSETSLLLRFPKGTTDLPIEIRFQNPILVEKHILELNFHIFSNAPGGELGVLLEDTRFTTHILKIAHLSFQDWKKFSVTLSPHIIQSNWVNGKESPLKLIGFIYTPVLTESKNREDIIVIDDITAKVIPKPTILPFSNL